jgi:hypothetical protein
VLTPYRSTPSAAMQKLLSPQITLLATSPQGKQLNTTLASNGTSFINGIFASQGTALTPAQAAQAKAAAFVLPGRTLGIFPIGLIITSTWALLFIGTIMYGTIGRMQFRDQFRRRKAAADRGVGQKTI